MVSLTSPRVSSAIAIIILVVYLFLITGGSDQLLNEDIILLFLLTVGTFIAIAAFNFAGNEIKKTEGVFSIIDLPKSKIIGIFLFSGFIAVGYDTLVLILIEIFSRGTSFSYSRFLVILIVLFLIFYPFFQYRFLALPGEDSSIPAEFVIEKTLEFIAEFVKSPFLVAVIAYFATYIIPMFILMFFLDLDVFLAIILVATILPLVSLGALAGAGIGEDLIRLRLIRNPIKDLGKLGLPKINIRELKFEIGGLLLVVFAIQAIITTAIFGVLSILGAVGIINTKTVVFTTFTLFVTLFNKGRGATKEMKEVWSEGGFKVNIFQLFLPVYVFLGVIMSSALEIFIGQDLNTGVLADIGLDDHRVLTSSVLVIQNFVMIATAILIFRNPPGTAERRLIKEVPAFYGNDTDGYLFIYGKLKSEQSVENLILEINKIVRKDISKADYLLPIIEESFNSGSDKVQIAVSELLLTITKNLKEFDEKYYKLVQLSLNSLQVGARIYAVRSMRNMLRFIHGEDKENAIKEFAKRIKDQDPVVSWDTSLALQKILTEEPEYRGFILALMIKSLIDSTYEGTTNAITRFLNRVARDSDEVGRMAINILGIQLSNQSSGNINNILEGIRALLRGNSFLAADLLDTIEIGIDNPDDDIRKDYYLVLTNLAQYGSGQDADVLHFIMRGVTDPSPEIQKIAYDALSKDVASHDDLVSETFTFLSEEYLKLAPQAKIGALNVFGSIAKAHFEYHGPIFDLVNNISATEDNGVKASLFSLLGIIAHRSPQFTENIYYLTEKSLNDNNVDVRVKAIHAIGVAVSGNSSLARAVHRRISDARNHNSLRVQLAAIEALGHVAAASRQLSDSIYGELQPLLEDDDWQVRLATLNGLFAASETRKDLYPNLVSATSYSLSDDDRTLRMASLDIVNFLIDKHRPASEEFLASIKKAMKDRSTSNDVKATLFTALELIAKQRGRLVEQIIPMIGPELDNPDASVRINLNDALKACVQKISTSRESGGSILKILNHTLTLALKAANNSQVVIRKSSYEAITSINVALPSNKIASRGRNAIETSLKHEKDVGLLEFLETCRIRSVPPRDF